jgi:isopentenyl-diphosphate Delta-isomerase
MDRHMTEIVSFDDELLVLVDDTGAAIGAKPKRECHLGEGVLHKAFSVFIFNSHGEVLLQRRSSGKMLWPSYWSNSCCSHPLIGEHEFTAARRRIHQELGMTISQLEKHFDFEYQASFGDIGSEWELCSVFTAFSDDPVHINKHEIDSVRWVAVDEMAGLLIAESEVFTPWIKLEWERLLPIVKSW